MYHYQYSRCRVTTTKRYGSRSETPVPETWHPPICTPKEFLRIMDHPCVCITSPCDRLAIILAHQSNITPMCQRQECRLDRSVRYTFVHSQWQHNHCSEQDDHRFGDPQPMFTTLQAADVGGALEEQVSTVERPDPCMRKLQAEGTGEVAKARHDATERLDL
ncbi:hypothetical protein BV20DRAFT_657861 [Pilatotrama ljubarskyi]|nr:hypothetical protein BV20DRAFT_657861 [Pilatotrama ljubarskyi]